MKRICPKTRFAVLALAALCLFTFLMASVSDCDSTHECADDQCTLCLCLSLWRELADFRVLVAAVCLLACVCVKCRLFSHNIIVPAVWTPVCLKVKLSD